MGLAKGRKLASWFGLSEDGLEMGTRRHVDLSRRCQSEGRFAMEVDGDLPAPRDGEGPDEQSKALFENRRERERRRSLKGSKKTTIDRDWILKKKEVCLRVSKGYKY